MSNLNLKYLTTNIFKLVDYSGVSDISFAHLLNISEKQLRLIKRGKADFNIQNINKACEFFVVSLHKLNKEEIEIEHNLRESLAKKHKNNSEYYLILSSRPSIRHAIKFALLTEIKFQQKGLRVDEIKTILHARGWEFTSRYISTSMGRLGDLVRVKERIVVNGKLVNVYSVAK